ncbi:quinon protein alcohol dehydrogenase-like superfamily [Infundibulicybe gibba]|nr:quinon protein alcohol dehydrogenase-like superfamily [Infundibulicybe gibba]
MDPLHMSLAAAYSPRTSSIYQTLQAGSPVRVISGIPENWGPCLGVIESTNHSITLSPDGRRLAVNSGRIGIWDAFTRCRLHGLSSESTQQHALAFSLDGARISSASEAGPLYIWDVQTGQLVRDLQGHTGSVVSVVEPVSLERPQRRAHQRHIAIDHGDVSTTRHGYLAVQSRGSPDRDAAFEPALLHPAPVAYSPDGKSFASASLDHTLRIWDLDSGEAIGEPLSEHTDSVTGVTYSPDGRYFASASNDKTVRIWDSSNHLSLAQLDHPDRVHGLAWSPNGAFIGTGCNDHIVRLWDVKTHSMTFQLTGHINSIRSVAFTPDSSGLVSGSDDMSIRIWDVATGTQVGDVLSGHTDYIHSIVICPDGRTIISGSQDHTIRFWDMRPRVDAPALAPVATTRAAKTSSTKISQFTHDSGFLLNDGWIRSPSLRKLLWVPHPYRGQITSREDGLLVVKGRNQTGDTVEELVLEFL